MSKTEFSPTRCEEQGEQANYDGELRTANPYHDARAAWWTAGWERAQVVRDEWEAGLNLRAALYG